MNSIMVLLVLATVLTSGTCLWVTMTFFQRELAIRRRKAIVVRAQWLGLLQALRQVIGPRTRELDQEQKEAFDALQFLWMQADLLESDEMKAINHCGTVLLALRHQPSLNHTQIRMAQRLIDQSYALIERAQHKAVTLQTIERDSWLVPLHTLLPSWLPGSGIRSRDQQEAVRLPTPSGAREP